MEAILPILLAEGARSKPRFVVLKYQYAVSHSVPNISLLSLPDILHNQNQSYHFLHNLKLSEDVFISYALIFCLIKDVTRIPSLSLLTSDVIF